MAIIVDIANLNGTPVFKVDQVLSDFVLKRLYGGKRGRDATFFPAFYPFYQDALRALEHEFPRLTLTPTAQAWVQEQEDYQNRIAQLTYNPAFKFITTPYQHQVEGFVFGIHNLRTGLLMDCGLGKSKVAIDIVRYAKQFLGEGGALVLVPRVILYKWAKEVEFHSGGELTPVVIDGTPKQKAKAIRTPGDMHILTYGTAAKMHEDIYEHLAYTTCIADESHNMQSHDSYRTVGAANVARKAARRIIMSGTASLGDPCHLYGQLDFLGQFMHEGSFTKFQRKYVKFGPGFGKIVPIGYKNLNVLQARVNRVGVRRTKEACLDLPERTFSLVNYTPSKPQKDLYNKLVKADGLELEELLKMPIEACAPTRLTKLLQVLSGYYVVPTKDMRICRGCSRGPYCAENQVHPYTADCKIVQEPPPQEVHHFEENPKLDLLAGLLQDQLVTEGSKSIIWAHYHLELDAVENKLKGMGVGTVRVDGRISGAEVAERVQRFQTDPDCRVFIGQIASGVGIDLVAASYVYYFSTDFSLASYLQSLDRAYRIGQTKKTFVTMLRCEGSVEDGVYQALQNKDEIRLALTDPEGFDADKEYMRMIVKPRVI